MIFVKKDGAFKGVEEALDMAVFPALQGGPHNHQIAAIATQMKVVASPAFKEYSDKVTANCRALAKGLTDLGHSLRWRHWQSFDLARCAPALLDWW